ncbi:MAG: EAL domain-containing protein [Gammaproteobacteria bacterium]
MSQDGLKHILLIDDDADFRNLLKTHLGTQFEGVELEEYDPAARGIPGDDFDWSRYDVLLLDYYLSPHGVTGLDILQANRKNLLFPATIMLTGAGNEEVAVRALKAGVHDYLRKEKLDKDKLRLAIIEAFEKKKSERERINELTIQNRAFNKALFYQELEQQQKAREGPDRVLLLINLDNNKLIEEQAGPIIRDNIVRHIARQSYDIFQLGNCNPYVTRFSDISVALLIDDPGSDKTLNFNLQGLCNHLKKRPYKYEDRKFRFSVSIGVVQLDDRFDGAESVIRTARVGSARAGEQSGNSYHIFRGPPEPAGQAGEQSRQESGEAGPDKTAPAAGTEVPAATGPETVTPVPATESPSESADKPAPETPKTEEQTGSEGNTSTPLEESAGKPPTEQEQDEPVKPDHEEEARRIKLAFDEQRITQTFQPIISLLSSEEAESGDTYYVSLQMLNKDGTITGADEIIPATGSSDIRQHIDRWMLREIMGRVVNSDGSHLFLIHLSRDSLADASLFNWLRNLLSGFDQARPGRSIALEIDAADFAALQKPAGALMSYLEKNHGFRFVLNGLGKEEDATSLCSQGRFSFLRLDHRLLNEAEDPSPEQEAAAGFPIESVKAQGIQIIADNIEDAMSLTATIGTGAEYAMGPFIGEPVDQLDDQTNIESFEIV